MVFSLNRLIMLAVTVRGRKWNPLRQRLDSYNYTVEQHVVSSLIFTPLLLLVPTTLVFYIFFTNINASISFLCVLVEITISILHATPYAELFLWMVRPKRFPSGVWFDILSDCSSNFPASPKLEILDGQHPEPHLHCKKTDMNAEGRGAVVSVLCINFSDLGKETHLMSYMAVILLLLSNILSNQQWIHRAGMLLLPWDPWNLGYWRFLWNFSCLDNHGILVKLLRLRIFPIPQ